MDPNVGASYLSVAISRRARDRFSLSVSAIFCAPRTDTSHWSRRVSVQCGCKLKHLQMTWLPIPVNSVPSAVSPIRPK